jgi:muramoyltetrapeptide carboxypeptidase LdcA involved in peptidoglycan recycling
LAAKGITPKEEPNDYADHPILPPRLRPGDVIGVFSPSFPAAAHWKDDCAVRFWQERGFRVKTGALYGQRDAYRSGSVQARAAEFNALLRDPEVTCLMAVSGGMTSNALLPHLDYDFLREYPKIIVGFSDATALLFGIAARTGLVTYYGPTFALFHRKPPVPEESYRFLSDILIDPPAPPYPLPTPDWWTADYIEWNERHRAPPSSRTAC